MSCQKCGDCCHYVTVLVPRGTGDPRWLTLHAGVEIIAREDGDLVKVPAVCSALQADNTCGIYADRPVTCSRYQCDRCVIDDIEQLERAAIWQTKPTLLSKASVKVSGVASGAGTATCTLRGWLEEE